MFTANEDLIISGFIPYKVIDIKRNEKTICKICSRNSVLSFADIRRAFRIASKCCRQTDETKSYSIFQYRKKQIRILATYTNDTTERESGYFLNMQKELQAIRKQGYKIELVIEKSDYHFDIKKHMQEYITAS